ncbi:hypothetical protein D9M71_362770 [compost metagenome]
MQDFFAALGGHRHERNRVIAIRFPKEECAPSRLPGFGTLEHMVHRVDHAMA